LIEREHQKCLKMSGLFFADQKAQRRHQEDVRRDVRRGNHNEDASLGCSTVLPMSHVGGGEAIENYPLTENWRNIVLMHPLLRQ
jgi:hypothetical protein